MSFQESVFYIVPLFALLALSEWLVGLYRKNNVYANIPDSIVGFSTGLGTVLAASIGIGFSLVSYEWMYDNFALFAFDSHSPLLWIMVIVLMDLAVYLKHRIRHHFNFFWQTHLIHHSSEEFNLSVSMRQQLVWEVVEFLTFFALPMAILGIPVEIVAVIGLIHTYYQIWYHTRLIGNLGWLEKIIVTPEQHQIHHAMNPEYIDKNFGAWFSVWDHMFGTYQAKIEGVEPVYGVTRPVRTWNPFTIELMHWYLMLKDIMGTQGFKSKLKVLVSRTNWRPEDTSTAFPVYGIDDVNSYEKFNPKISLSTLLWSMTEFTFFVGLTLLYFTAFSDLSSDARLYQGLFLFFNMYVYTSFMEGKSIVGLLLARLSIFALGSFALGIDWFYMDTVSESILPFCLAFFCLSILISTFSNRKQTTDAVTA